MVRVRACAEPGLGGVLPAGVPYPRTGGCAAVSVTPWENVAQWEEIVRQSRKGAKAMAEAMARYLAERAAWDTLQRSTHAPGEYYKAPRGAPPASASGHLASSMYWTRAQGSDTKARAFAGNSADYAKLLEHGCEPVTPVRGKVMHWTDSEGSWYHARLPAREDRFPEHPFLAPTVDESVEDGELRRVALEAFEPYDP